MRGENVLDLVIASMLDQTNIKEVMSIQDAGIFTDHRTILFEVDAFIKLPQKRLGLCTIIEV